MLQTFCKQEHNERPCPRIVLVCCTALVTNGLYTEGLFSEEAPMELVHYLLGAFEEGDALIPSALEAFRLQQVLELLRLHTVCVC